MKKVIILVLLWFLICPIGCKNKTKKERVFVWSNSLYCSNWSGKEIRRTIEPEWNEAVILEKKAGLWKVKWIEKGVNGAEQWIDPNDWKIKKI